MTFETKNIVELLGTILIIVDIGLIFYIVSRKGGLTSRLKKLMFAAIIILPVGIGFLANYHVFETSKTVGACQNCHVMKPFAHDIVDETSMTLAARHYKNNWIANDQCYSCHADYGFNGKLKAKTDGYRHLMRYITRTYHEPIVYKGEFNNANCMGCHQQTGKFKNVEMHVPLIAQFESNEISCMNCHGRAHPTPLQRTPGSADYDRLMSKVNLDGSEQEISSAKKAAVQAYINQK